MMKRIVLDVGFGLLALGLGLYLRMQWYDHQHVQMLCTKAVPVGFCDNGPAPTK